MIQILIIIICGEGIMFTGCVSIRLSIHCPVSRDVMSPLILHTYWRDVGKICHKCHYVTGRCSNGIEDQRSKVKVLTKRINPWWRMHTSWQCGIKAHLLSPTFMLTMLCLCWCISDAVKWMQHWLSEVETMQKFSHATSSWKTVNGVFKILSEEIALCLCHWQMYLRLRDTP